MPTVDFRVTATERREATRTILFAPRGLAHMFEIDMGYMNTGVRVLVTGGSSPLGDVVVPQLVAQGFQVTCLVRSDIAGRRCRPHSVELVMGDLDCLSLDQFTTYDKVIHLAGMRHVGAALDLASAMEVGMLVAISSASAVTVGHPNRDWLLDAEREALSTNVRVSILRPTMIYGSPRDRNVRRLVAGLRRLPAVPHFTGGGRIMPVLADDVGEAILESINRDLSGVRAVGGPEPTRLGAIVEAIAMNENMKRIPARIPLSSLSRLATLLPFGHGKTLHAIQMLARDRVVPSPPQEGFDFNPTTLEKGVRVALRRYQSS